MKRTTIVAGVATGMLAVPAVAVADRMLVDHGHGPTVVHDAAYGEVKTQVHAWSKDGVTRVRLMVRGLPAERTFGAHVHTAPCGADPLASGGHYQHSQDASVPLADREVWLDVTTDAQGNATTETTVPWSFAPGTAGSVVIHAAPTNTDGSAGPRLVCTTVPFGE
jgi:Cu-Zn family superoxide dismutase